MVYVLRGIRYFHHARPSQVIEGRRIEVQTVGVLIQRLRHDRRLNNVGAVIFDEFHERNIDRQA